MAAPLASFEASPIVLDRQFGNPNTFGSIEAAAHGLGHVVVLDGMNHRILLFTEDGQLVHQAGARGAGPGEFLSPVDVDITPWGEVLILDQGNLRIDAYRIESDSLAFLGDYRTPGPANAMCFLGGRLFLLGMFNGALLHELDRDGELVRSFGQPPSDPLFSTVLALGRLACSEQTGRLAIASRTTPEIRVFDLSGQLLAVDSIPGFQGTVYERTGGGAYRPQPPTGGVLHETVAAFWLQDSTVVIQYGTMPPDPSIPPKSARFSLVHGWTAGPSWPRYLNWMSRDGMLAANAGLYPTVGAYHEQP